MVMNDDNGDDFMLLTFVACSCMLVILSVDRYRVIVALSMLACMPTSFPSWVSYEATEWG